MSLLKNCEIVDTFPPHLVPLPMGEEALSRLAVFLKKIFMDEASLTSPMGRGVRQRGEGGSSGGLIDKMGIT